MLELFILFAVVAFAIMKPEVFFTALAYIAGGIVIFIIIQCLQQGISPIQWIKNFQLAMQLQSFGLF